MKKISELFRCIIILWTKSTVITIHMHHIDVKKSLVKHQVITIGTMYKVNVNDEKM